MAKQLPDLGTVGDNWYLRLAAILNGTNATEKAADFKQRTRRMWVQEVINDERRQAIADAEAAKESAFETIDSGTIDD